MIEPQPACRDRLADLSNGATRAFISIPLRSLFLA